MKKLIYGFDPRAVRGDPPTGAPLPITAKDLMRIGVAAHKIPRVREELARLVVADPSLRGRATLLKLARQIARQFL